MPEQTPPAKAPNEAPFGASPVSGPSPNRGFEAAALQRVGVILKQLTEVLPLVGATSELGKDIMSVMTKLAKHVPAGSVSPAGEKAQLERSLMQNTQNNQQMQALKQQAKPPMPGGAPGAPGGAQSPAQGMAA